jgi:hypothetical protein
MGALVAWFSPFSVVVTRQVTQSRGRLEGQKPK